MGLSGADVTIEVEVHAAALARGALRRIAEARLEPTPENFAKAYVEEAGVVGAPAQRPGNTAVAVAWPAIVERLVRHLDRGSKQWTVSRRKESLHRVLDSSRSDEARLAQRLQALLLAWEGDRVFDGVETAGLFGHEHPVEAEAYAVPAGLPARQHAQASVVGAAQELLHAYNDALLAGLQGTDKRGAMIGRRLSRCAESPGAARADAEAVREGVAACAEATGWFEQRQELMRQLSSLSSELSQGLVDLVDDDSWTRGQCEAVRLQLREPMDVKSLRAASALLADTRARQQTVKQERQAAKAMIKQLLSGMISEVGALQEQAGGFESAIEQHAAAVQEADSLEGLTLIVQAMLEDSRGIRAVVGAANERLRRDGDRAAALDTRVRDLETELRRISDEASTDALTQVANRRGLERLFAQACERAMITKTPLAIGLLDIDNFKKLNDRLGHAAGDMALKALAGAVRERLRPEDQVARFGGEEFVVLLGGLHLEPAQLALTRLQRGLTAGLFLHEGEEVLVTFSAGVTLWRPGDSLEATVERADGAMYEAKRTGKNRTCVA